MPRYHRAGALQLIAGVALLAPVTLLPGCNTTTGGVTPATATPMAGAPSTGPASRGGRFAGVLAFTQPRPREAGDPPFGGAIEGDRILIRAARGERLAAPLDAQGHFSAEGVLRQHQLGTKMQFYTGRVADGVVTVQARFVVPGYPRTECVATGRIPIVGT